MLGGNLDDLSEGLAILAVLFWVLAHEERDDEGEAALPGRYRNDHCEDHWHAQSLGLGTEYFIDLQDLRSVAWNHRREPGMTV
ncbi:hypothetical protein D3C80_1962190 [compost metagenome]